VTDYVSRLLRACCGDPFRGTRDNRDEISPLHFTSSATEVEVLAENDAIIFDIGREGQKTLQNRSRHLPEVEVFVSLIGLSV
jgi:hypothetical protein